MSEKINGADFSLALTQKVEQFRDNGGEGGCFFDPLREIQAKAGIIETCLYMGIIPLQKYRDALQQLHAIVTNLPPLQTPEALDAVYEQLGEIEFFKPLTQDV